MDVSGARARRRKSEVLSIFANKIIFPFAIVDFRVTLAWVAVLVTETFAWFCVLSSLFLGLFLELFLGLFYSIKPTVIPAENPRV